MPIAFDTHAARNKVFAIVVRRFRDGVHAELLDGLEGHTISSNELVSYATTGSMNREVPAVIHKMGPVSEATMARFGIYMTRHAKARYLSGYEFNLFVHMFMQWYLQNTTGKFNMIVPRDGGV